MLIRDRHNKKRTERPRAHLEPDVSLMKWGYRTEQQDGKHWKVETCTREKHRKKKRWMKDHRAEVKGFICRAISEGITVRSEFSPRFLDRVRGDGEREDMQREFQDIPQLWRPGWSQDRTTN